MARYANTSQETPEEQQFWLKFCACAGQSFKTAQGLEFTFSVIGNEIFFSRRSKSITRATIIKAYRTAMEITAETTIVAGPKKLLVFGASYLYPVFIKVGLFSAPPHATKHSTVASMT